MSHQADELRLALIRMAEDFAPMFEAAEGQRAELERRGWSPAMSEQIAATLLMHFLNSAFTASSK